MRPNDDSGRHLPGTPRVRRRARRAAGCARRARRPARARRRWCCRSCATGGCARPRTSTSAAAASSRSAWRRRPGVPVALACTSGTAAANYAPAVIEAHEARVPLLVLTADRPPELRDVGAGQTIDQVKLYGSAAKWFQEVDDHAGDGGAAALAARARLPRVLDRARRAAGPGPPQLRAARAARARRAAARRRARRRRPGRRTAVGDADRAHGRGDRRRRRRARAPSARDRRRRAGGARPGAGRCGRGVRRARRAAAARRADVGRPPR